MIKILIFALLLMPLMFSCGNGNDENKEDEDRYYYGDNSRSPSGPTLDIKYHDPHVSNGRGTSRIISGSSYWIEIPGRKCSQIKVFEVSPDGNEVQIFYSGPSASPNSCRTPYRMQLYYSIRDKSDKLQAQYYNVNDKRNEYSGYRSVSKESSYQPVVN